MSQIIRSQYSPVRMSKTEVSGMGRHSVVPPWWLHVTTHLAKPTECAATRSEPQHKLQTLGDSDVSFHAGSSVVKMSHSGGRCWSWGSLCMWGAGGQGRSLNPPLNYSVNLQFLKNQILLNFSFKKEREGNMSKHRGVSGVWMILQQVCE